MGCPGSNRSGPAEKSPAQIPPLILDKKQPLTDCLSVALGEEGRGAGGLTSGALAAAPGDQQAGTIMLAGSWPGGSVYSIEEGAGGDWGRA